MQGSERGFEKPRAPIIKKLDEIEEGMKHSVPLEGQFQQLVRVIRELAENEGDLDLFKKALDEVQRKTASEVIHPKSPDLIG